MHVLQHQIEVNASAQRAYELCLHVERWPEIFPPCKGTKVIEQTERSQLIKISALANGQIMSWLSRRALHPEARVISFQQVRPAPLLKHMEGTWRFFQLKSGTLIVLEHRFAIKEQVVGLLEGISTPAEALTFMESLVHGNSKRELLAVKKILEMSAHAGRRSELCGEFEAEMTIAGTMESVYGLLRRAWEWPQLLPHCRAVDVLYDDGQDQELVMTIDVSGREERVRSIRRCTPMSSIAYFEPEPPPALQRHAGEWLLEPSPRGGVRLVARHSVELRLDGVKEIWGDITSREALAKVTRAIHENSRGTMLAIRSLVEPRG
jgi:aromatase